MKNSDFYLNLAAARLGKLKDEPEIQGGYEELFIETSVKEITFTEIDGFSPAGHPYFAVPFEFCPQPFVIPGIPLSNGNSFFYGRTIKKDLINFLENPSLASLYRGETWNEISINFSLKDEVFLATALRRTLENTWQNWTGKVYELQPGDQLKAINVPFTFAGTEEPPLPIEHFNLPLNSINAPPVDKSKYYFFFFEQFGIIPDETNSYHLPCGCIWYSQTSTYETELFLGRTLYTTYENLQTFTGILAIPKAKYATYDHQSSRESYLTVETKIKRLRSYLNIKHRCSPTLIGCTHFEELPNQPSLAKNIKFWPHEYYKSPTKDHLPYNSKIAAKDFATAIQTTFSEPSKKSLTNYIHRSLESIDLARTITNKPISLLLLWTSIEALISSKEENNISTNIALNLLPLIKTNDRIKMFKQLKKSYSTRSNIVHAFEVPNDPQLTETIELTNKMADLIIRFSIENALPKSWNKADIFNYLQAAAIQNISLKES